jgi:hypothetical protein
MIILLSKNFSQNYKYKGTPLYLFIPNFSDFETRIIDFGSKIYVIEADRMMIYQLSKLIIPLRDEIIEAFITF